MTIDLSKPNRDTTLLAPFFQDLLLKALLKCADEGITNLAVFEGYRSPARQDWLYDQGRKRPGVRVTNARAWQSWHQLSLAVDCVFKVGKAWTWEGDWVKVHEIFESVGFETISWERPHFQLTAGMQIAEAAEMSRVHGVGAVWDLVKTRFLLQNK